MGYLRSIAHPDVEIREFDLSNVASTQGGTTSLVIGFAKQGESLQPVQPTSKASFKTYFGSPETEAERYFYYAGAEVFDKGGSLIAARIPYNNNAQNLTPAVTYKIEEAQLSVNTRDRNQTTSELITSYETTSCTYASTSGDLPKPENFDRWFYLDSDTDVNKITTKHITTYLNDDANGTKDSWVLDTYKLGDGTVISCNPNGETRFIEIITASNEITADSNLTRENFDANKFSYVISEFPLSTTSTEYSIGNVVAAATSADVTESDLFDGGLAIPALDGKKWYDVYRNYPAFAYQTKFGMDTKMKILTSVNGDTETVKNKYEREGKFYQCVTTFTSVSAIASAGSQNYKWIEWTESPASSTFTGDTAMMAAILGCKEKDVPSQLNKVKNVVTISPMDSADDYGWMALSSYQSLRDGTEKAPKNQIIIANITEEQFAVDQFNNNGEEVLGIVPILLGGVQCLPKQSRITLPDNITNAHIFNAVESFARGKNIPNMPDEVIIKRCDLNANSYAKELGNVEEYEPFASTYSNDIINKMPTVNLNSSYKPNGEQMNYVTLVVGKLSSSAADDNKLVLTILETFTGSLDRECKDSKGNSIFIDDIVNSEESGSTYVKLFSNYESSMAEVNSRVSINKTETKEEPTSDNTILISVPTSIMTPIKSSNKENFYWWRQKKNALSIGFTKEQTKKYISYSTLVASLESIFDTLSNVDELDIDIVVDAGLSTIANRLKHLIDASEKGDTKFEYDVFFDEIKDLDSIAAWKSICSKFLTFCSTTRKDCMALLDAPRSLCVKDSAKLVRPNTRPQYSIDYDILPKFNYLAGLNSSYGAGYCTWMSYVDDFSGKTVWLPPSIAAEGSLLTTDNNYNYWDAPAGVKRGTVTAASDVAFNPNAAQQDSIYSKSWNYCKRTNAEGVLIWGQKTLLTTNSSFSRINVRRLFLRLERMTRKFLKDYIFEINNLKNRNRIIDGLTPIYENVKTMGGLYDYQLICSSELNNSATVIDNNELRFAALLKPSRVAEFICTSFFALATGMDFTEAYSEL